MSDCAYGSKSPLGQWGPVKMSGRAYGSNSPLGQVRSIAKAFLFLLRVRLAKKVQADSCWSVCQFSQGIGHVHGRLQCGRQGNARHEH